jgi:hypothetical protein
MTIVNANRVRENTTGNGTGALALLGAVRNFQTFSAGVGNGNQCYYAITHQSANEWEVGLGTFTLSAGIPYLSRNTVYSSSNGNALVDFSSGTKQVAVVYPGTQIDTIASNVGVAAGYANDALTYSNLASTAAVNANIYKVSAAAEASLAGVYAAQASVSYVNAASAAAQAASLAAQISSVAVDASNAAVAASLAQIYKTSASAYATEAGGYASVAQIYKVSASAFATDAANYASIAGVRANTASIAAVSANNAASIAGVYANTASIAAVSANNAASVASAAAANAANSASIAAVYANAASIAAVSANNAASLAGYYVGLINPSAYALLSSTNTFTGANNFTSVVNVQSALSVTGNFFVSGVTTLASAVDVKGATSLASTLVANGNATFNSTVSVSSAVVVGPGTAGTPSISTTGDTNTGIYFPAGNTLAASTAGSERMRIDSAGNVGIGTTSPAYKLDVNGAIRMPNATVIFMNDSSGVAKQTLQLFSDDNTYMSTPGALILRTNGTTERMRINSSGNVGIGTTSPSVRLQIENATGESLRLSNTTGSERIHLYARSSASTSRIESQNGSLEVFAYDPYPLVLGTNNVERMRIDASGNVGIGGATSLASTLVVNGAGTFNSNVSVSGTFTVSGVANLLSAVNLRGATSIGGTLITTGNATFSGNVSVSGTFTTSGVATFVSSVDIKGATSLASTLKVNSSVVISSDLSFNSGYGSGALAYGVRAWVNFNGTGTIAIRNSGNVSSLTDNGVGDYTINFATNFPDANYACAGFSQQGNGDAAPNGVVALKNPATITTSAVRIIVGTPGNNAFDRDYVYVVAVR